MWKLCLRKRSSDCAKDQCHSANLAGLALDARQTVLPRHAILARLTVLACIAWFTNAAGGSGLALVASLAGYTWRTLPAEHGSATATQALRLRGKNKTQAGLAAIQQRGCCAKGYTLAVFAIVAIRAGQTTATGPALSAALAIFAGLAVRTRLARRTWHRHRLNQNSGL